MRRSLLASCLALFLAVPAFAQNVANAVSVDEAKAWDAQMKAFEQAGDRRLLSSLRPHTVLTVDLEPQRGARVQVSLDGERLLAFMEQSLAQNRAQAGQLTLTPRCDWYSNPKTGDAVETCTIGIKTRKKMPGTPAVMYSYSIISKDSQGLYVRSGWLSDKKMF